MFLIITNFLLSKLISTEVIIYHYKDVFVNKYDLWIDT